MKKILTLIVVAFAFCLAGCASLPKAATAQTPAQVAAQVCPSLQSVVSVLSVPGAIDASDAANVAKAAPVIASVCYAPAAATAINLKSLQVDAVPVLLKAIQAAPNISSKDKQDATLGIAIAQAAIAPVIAQAEASAPLTASAAK
jgi:hypothetical protein